MRRNRIWFNLLGDQPGIFESDKFRFTDDDAVRDIQWTEFIGEKIKGPGVSAEDPSDVLFYFDHVEEIPVTTASGKTAIDDFHREGSPQKKHFIVSFVATDRISTADWNRGETTRKDHVLSFVDRGIDSGYDT